MSLPLLVVLAGILWLAYNSYLEHQRKLAKAGGALPSGELADLARRIEAAVAERARLVARVENLEAIVTSESFDLDRAAKAALPPASEPPRLAPDAPQATGDEAEVARLARRVRGA